VNSEQDLRATKYRRNTADLAEEYEEDDSSTDEEYGHLRKSG
jgi:hypothetical protein